MQRLECRERLRGGYREPYGSVACCVLYILHCTIVRLVANVPGYKIGMKRALRRQACTGLTQQNHPESRTVATCTCAYHAYSAKYDRPSHRERTVLTSRGRLTSTECR